MNHAGGEEARQRSRSWVFNKSSDFLALNDWLLIGMAITLALTYTTHLLCVALVSYRHHRMSLTAPGTGIIEPVPSGVDVQWIVYL